MLKNGPWLAVSVLGLWVGLALNPHGARLVAMQAESQDAAHFHHVHLNVTDPEESVAFYRKFFGAVEIQYAGKTQALFTERSFILFNKVDTKPPTNLATSIWHIGWGGVDGPSEYQWMKSQGARFEVDLTPLGSSHYMYLKGADDEIVEVFTGGRNHRFNHVHFVVTDVNATTDWFARHLGLEPRTPAPVEPAERRGRLRWSNAIRVDNVSMVVYGVPDPDNPPSWLPKEAKIGALAPTRGSSIDHLGFSYRDIEPVFERMKEAGAKIVGPITRKEDLGTRSFFALAPDGLLIEIVEARPIPDSVWE